MLTCWRLEDDRLKLDNRILVVDEARRAFSPWKASSVQYKLTKTLQYLLSGRTSAETAFAKAFSFELADAEKHRREKASELKSGKIYHRFRITVKTSAFAWKLQHLFSGKYQYYVSWWRFADHRLMTPCMLAVQNCCIFYRKCQGHLGFVYSEISSKVKFGAVVRLWKITYKLKARRNHCSSS